MKKLFVLISILTLSLSLAACSQRAGEPTDSSSGNGLEYTDGKTIGGYIYVFVDEDTKCHYLVKQDLQSAFITPRMNPDGTQMCAQP